MVKSSSDFYDSMANKLFQITKTTSNWSCEDIFLEVSLKILKNSLFFLKHFRLKIMISIKEHTFKN